MNRRDFLQTSVAAALGTRLPAPQAPLFEQSDVYVSGVGYPTYRIPSLITTRRGTLLAFAEGRQARGDHAQNDIVLRRSLDAGRSWDWIGIVARDRPNVLANPTAVEVSASGRLWLMYQRYLWGFDERLAVPGYDDPRVCRTFVVHSDDDGVSWSAPREVTREVKRPTRVTSTASGPGIGVELTRGPHRGRLVVPFNEGPYGDWRVYAAYSDDRGATWRYGETAPDDAPGAGNEVQVVELADGVLMLNARNQGGNRHRKVALSRDGGQSWSPLADDPQLPDPECQGTILRYSFPDAGGRSRILFANPAAPGQRMNGTVRMSYDEGRSWPVARTVYAGSFAYSCLTRLADGTIGLLYERDGYGKITFARFDLAWLTASP